MDQARTVNTKQELKSAIKKKEPKIETTNKDLIKHVQNIKRANKAGILAVAGSAGVAAYNWWNPVGWGAAGFSGLTAATTTGGTAFYAASALGIGGIVLIALYKDYNVKVETGLLRLELKK